MGFSKLADILTASDFMYFACFLSRSLCPSLFGIQRLTDEDHYTTLRIIFK